MADGLPSPSIIRVFALSAVVAAVSEVLGTLLDQYAANKQNNKLPTFHNIQIIYKRDIMDPGIADSFA